MTNGHNRIVHCLLNGFGKMHCNLACYRNSILGASLGLHAKNTNRHFSEQGKSNDGIFDLKGIINIEKPLVEMRGDAMAQVLSDMVKEQLLKPYLRMPLDTFDLSLENRIKTNNEVVFQAIDAIRTYNIGVKIPTLALTSNTCNVPEKKSWFSASVTLREHLDGALFREPILVDNMDRLIKTWTKPIIVCRHAFGDQYMHQSMEINKSGKVELKFTPEDGSEPMIKCIHNFKNDNYGVCLGMFNTQKSVSSFARCCFRYCLQHKLPLYLSIKQTVLEAYDGMFKMVFDNIYKEFKEDFKAAGIWYDTLFVDEMVVQALRSEGGFVWACKNYDGDVNADLVSVGFGSRWLMTSTLLCPDYRSCVIEPAHGPIPNHYEKYKQGMKTSTIPLATIFSWTRALQKRQVKNMGFINF
ncbi:bifunctional Isocitrate dehydrogenase NADP-dependent/Isopropylmalate dehydrogenase-like domain [Babesia duncani]|uniref:Isocitrate dehydrogenase [NADP] n=1 Tax=Babesia duncani TaxID=323732 RepID=A0AAD9PL19_9APIC|nr:bifunctional Isocitrate dehydrogenase NADP-dependent/Isopropylmalate dehydrogenase-like domain [Babesia duncani]